MRTFWLFCIYVAVTICWIEIQAVSNAIDRNTAALTNHAPVVVTVTNTVYVTNECTKQHWPVVIVDSGTNYHEFNTNDTFSLPVGCYKMDTGSGRMKVTSIECVTNAVEVEK